MILIRTHAESRNRKRTPFQMFFSFHTVCLRSMP